jgi:hypothetical protein
MQKRHSSLADDQHDKIRHGLIEVHGSRTDAIDAPRPAGTDAK